MTDYAEQRCDRIAVNYYLGGDEPVIDFVIDGEDRGGWPPDYFRHLEVRQHLPDGTIEVGFKPIIGRDLYIGPMDEKSLDIIEPYFDYILEGPSSNGVDGDT